VQIGYSVSVAEFLIKQ